MNVSMSSTVESNKVHDINNCVYGIYLVLLCLMFCMLFTYMLHIISALLTGSLPFLQSLAVISKYRAHYN